MSAPKPNNNDDDNNNNNRGDGEKGKEAAVAKTAGFVVFSGIAMSIIKALTPNFNNTHNGNPASTPSCERSTPPPIQAEAEKQFSPQTVEIVKGDTLWGLSRKYGVSIDAIKEANGLSGDTIYAGKKLVIP